MHCKRTPLRLGFPSWAPRPATSWTQAGGFIVKSRGSSSQRCTWTSKKPKSLCLGVQAIISGILEVQVRQVNFWATKPMIVATDLAGCRKPSQHGRRSPWPVPTCIGLAQESRSRGSLQELQTNQDHLDQMFLQGIYYKSPLGLRQYAEPLLESLRPRVFGNIFPYC